MLLLVICFFILISSTYHYYNYFTNDEYSTIIKHKKQEFQNTSFHLQLEEKYQLSSFCNEHFMCNEASDFVPTFRPEYFSDKSCFYLCKRNKVIGILVYYEILYPIHYLYISILCIHREYRKQGYAKLLIEALQRRNLSKKPAIFCLDQRTYKYKLPTLPTPSLLLTEKEVVWFYVDAKWCKDHRLCLKTRFQTKVYSTLALDSYQQKEGEGTNIIYFQRLPLVFKEIQYVYSLEYVLSTSQEIVEVDPLIFLQVPCIITVQIDDLYEKNFSNSTFSKDFVYLHDPSTDTRHISSILYQKNEKKRQFFLPL